MPAPEQPKEEEPEELLPEITIDDFAKVDLRVAQILDVEEVKKSDKLLKLTVQVGDETRTVVSGIKPWYNKDKLLGRKVVLVANLKPAKLRGIESQGMILAADNGPDDVRVLMLDGDVESGSKVR